MTSSDGNAGGDFELVYLANGSVSLRQQSNGETYHPGIGPMCEAVELHLAGTRLVERAKKLTRSAVVWDVGLGAAANAVAALESQTDRLSVHSFDVTMAPLEFAMREAASLGYPLPWLSALTSLCESGRWASCDGTKEWRIHLGDFTEILGSADAPAPDAIFWDPYSLRTSPGIWTLETFTALLARLDPDRGCLMTSYSRSSAVRVTLLLAGFFVGAGEGVGEKDEMTVAANQLDLLNRPLGPEWLSRVRRSSNAAPLRSGRTSSQPIAEEDWVHLLQHPQFFRDQSADA